MKEQLANLKNEFIKSLENIETNNELETLEKDFLGKK
jgi:hypothetical protein